MHVHQNFTSARLQKELAHGIYVCKGNFFSYTKRKRVQRPAEATYAGGAGRLMMIVAAAGVNCKIQLSARGDDATRSCLPACLPAVTVSH